MCHVPGGSVLSGPPHRLPRAPAAAPEEVYVHVHIWLHISVDIELLEPPRAIGVGPECH